MSSHKLEEIKFLPRSNGGIGNCLRQLACGDWQTTDSSEQAYEKYCHAQWRDFAQGRLNFAHYSVDITELFKMFREDKPREHIITQLNVLRKAGERPLSEQDYHHMIDFAARIISAINMGTLPNELNPRRHLQWSSGTLRSRIAAHFNEPPVLTFEHLRLPKNFDAWSLSKVGGIKIRFTDNLADHLLLIDDDTAILVFHQVSYLRQQDEQTLLPAGLAEETIMTIALLFPQTDFSESGRSKRNKRQWLKSLYKSHEIEYVRCVDERLSRCGSLPTSKRRIERFKFWRDRLVVLKQAYDETTPNTMSQWWHDRRNGPQWYTFWVAGLVVATVALVLTVAQVVEGALQVYLAYHPVS